MRGELRVIARDVAGEAKDIADRKGLRDSGRLIGSIKPSVSVRGGSSGVRVSASVTANATSPQGFSTAGCTCDSQRTNGGCLPNSHPNLCRANLVVRFFKRWVPRRQTDIRGSAAMGRRGASYPRLKVTRVRACSVRETRL